MVLMMTVQPRPIPRCPISASRHTTSRSPVSRLFTFLAVGAIVVGVVLVLQPTVMNALHAQGQSKELASYDDAVSQMDDETLAAALEEAEAYNDHLPSQAVLFEMSSKERSVYQQILDPAKTGVMGSLTIPVLDLTLPIYHGTSDENMLKGACHVEGTALPVGEPSTHAGITAHRGEPGASYFRYLDQVAVGDTFSVSVLGKVATYEVDRITVVEPDDLGALASEEGMAYCTLITCTPYEINSHRLLVRGHVVDVQPAG